jgi:hypothetical protein
MVRLARVEQRLARGQKPNVFDTFLSWKGSRAISGIYPSIID